MSADEEDDEDDEDDVEVNDDNNAGFTLGCFEMVLGTADDDDDERAEIAEAVRFLPAIAVKVDGMIAV